MGVRLDVREDAERVGVAAAEAFVRAAREAILDRGRFVVALAGGSTPKRMYQLLAEPKLRAKSIGHASSSFGGTNGPSRRTTPIPTSAWPARRCSLLWAFPQRRFTACPRIVPISKLPQPSTKPKSHGCSVAISTDHPPGSTSCWREWERTATRCHFSRTRQLSMSIAAGSWPTMSRSSRRSG